MTAPIPTVMVAIGGFLDKDIACASLPHEAIDLDVVAKGHDVLLNLHHALIGLLIRDRPFV
jgi:hypothetical protein